MAGSGGVGSVSRLAVVCGERLVLGEAPTGGGGVGSVGRLVVICGERFVFGGAPTGSRLWWWRFW